MEGKLKYQVLEGELALINDPDIQDWTLRTLQKVPEYFWYAPTSMTGKYHPACSNGRAGLIIHVKRVVYLANKICHAWGIFAQERDIVLASCILHDIAKCPPGTPYLEHENHPINAAGYFAKGGTPGVVNMIDSCVRFHMGRWTPKAIAKDIRDYELLELAVYTADYLSSLKDLETPRDKDVREIKEGKI